MRRLLSSKAQEHENHLNPVMLVLIGKLSLSILSDEYPCARVSVTFQVFCIFFIGQISYQQQKGVFPQKKLRMFAKEVGIFPIKLASFCRQSLRALIWYAIFTMCLVPAPPQGSSVRYLTNGFLATFLSQIEDVLPHTDLPASHGVISAIKATQVWLNGHFLSMNIRKSHVYQGGGGGGGDRKDGR